MSEIDINYKGSTIASMDASGTKTLLTSGKYCEDDVEIVYTRPSGGGGGGDSDFSVVPVVVTSNLEYEIRGDLANILDYGEEWAVASLSPYMVIAAGDTETFYAVLYQGLGYLMLDEEYLISVSIDGSTTQSVKDFVEITEACTIVIDEAE